MSLREGDIREEEHQLLEDLLTDNNFTQFPSAAKDSKDDSFKSDAVLNSSKRTFAFSPRVSSPAVWEPVVELSEKDSNNTFLWDAEYRNEVAEIREEGTLTEAFFGEAQRPRVDCTSVRTNSNSPLNVRNNFNSPLRVRSSSALHEDAAFSNFEDDPTHSASFHRELEPIFLEFDAKFTKSGLLQARSMRRDCDSPSDEDTSSQTPDRQEELSENVILSLCYAKGMLGACCYVLDSQELHIMCDIMDLAPEHKAVHRLFSHFKPYAVVTPFTFCHSFTEELKSLTRSGSDMDSWKPPLYFLRTADFNLELSTSRVLQIRLPSEPAMITDEEHEIFMRSLIDFQAVQMIRSIGGLFRFLETTDLPLAKIGLPAKMITSIQKFAVDCAVMVDDDTLRALRVFEAQMHPSAYKRGTKAARKESGSLFALINHTSSTEGKRTLRSMLMRPIRDRRRLEQRYDAIEFLSRGEQIEMVKKIQQCLHHIKSMNQVMYRMRCGIVDVRMWKKLYETLQHGLILAYVCKEAPPTLHLLEEIAAFADSSLQLLFTLVREVIDFEASSKAGRFCVNFGISVELDKKRRLYNGLGDLLSQVAHLELPDLPESVNSCKVSYVQNIGFLTGISHVEGIELPSHFTFKFRTEKQHYFKTTRTIHLDNCFGDVLTDIMDMEASISLTLTEKVIGLSQDIFHLIRLSFQLDAILSLAIAAKMYDLVRPQLTDAENLEIIDGRNIIQEMFTDVYISNNVNPKYKVTLITGPNASGKSVYLKMIALIPFMAFVGSFVPARVAVIPLFDGIFGRISNHQSVSDHLSSFMTEAAEMSRALRFSTPCSLVIIDEFGRGTREIDGRALFRACVKDFCKHDGFGVTFMISHYCDLVFPEESIDYRYMEYIIRGDECILLYKMQEGVAVTEYAYCVAQQAGVPALVIERARSIRDALVVGKEVVAYDHDSRRSQFTTKVKNIIEKVMNIEENKEPEESNVVETIRALEGEFQGALKTFHEVGQTG